MARNEHKKVLQQLSEAYQNVISEGITDALKANPGAAKAAPQQNKQPSNIKIPGGQLPGGHNAEQQQAGAAIKKAFDKGPGGVRAFLDSAEGKDPKVRQFLKLAQEQFDGNAIDDNITVADAPDQPLGQLFPTQSFIDLMQSVSFPLGSAEELKKSITKKKGFGKISLSNNAILDGHHRWSGQFAITPDGTIDAVNIDLPGKPNQRLAALQLAIGAINPNPAAPHPSKGGGAETDILGKDEGSIYQMILANVGKQTDKKAPGALLNNDMLNDIIRDQDPVILEWLGATQGQLTKPEQVKEAIARRVANNLSRLKQPQEQAPPRPDMPQLDHETIGGDEGLEKIKAGLKAGSLNVVPPFTKQEPAVKESRLRAKDELKLMSEAYENLRP
jgi:hypothetical protein